MATPSMSDEDLQHIENANALKAQGNECFKEKRYYRAIDFYSQALEEYPNSVILSNRAQAYLNIHRHELAYSDANESLLLDPANVKALFRRALALHKLGFDAKARADLLKCVERDSKNEEAKKLLKLLKDAFDEATVDVTHFQKLDSLKSTKPLRKLKINVKQTFGNAPKTKNKDPMDMDVGTSPSSHSKTRLESGESDLPKPAKTFNEFLRAWIELKKNPPAFATYFLTLDLDHFNVLFDSLADLDILPTLIHGLYQALLTTPQSLYILLRFSKTSRFNISVAFLEDTTKQELSAFLARYGPEYLKEVEEIETVYYL